MIQAGEGCRAEMELNSQPALMEAFHGEACKLLGQAQAPQPVRMHGSDHCAFSRFTVGSTSFRWPQIGWCGDINVAGCIFL